jgi:DNA-binding transcriptional MerR regulator
MSIGELAKATGVKIVSVRYYEQIKVAPAPARTQGNYRAYELEHLHRLQFV